MKLRYRVKDVCRFQLGGSPQITAATARRWSSCGELWTKSRRHLSVTRWERGRHPVVALTSTFVTLWVYGILRLLRSAHVSSASMREHWSFVMDHVTHSYNKTGTVQVWLRHILVFSLMLDFQILFPASSCRIELCQSDAERSYQVVRKCDDKSNRLETLPTDRRTDLR